MIKKTILLMIVLYTIASNFTITNALENNNLQNITEEVQNKDEISITAQSAAVLDVRTGVVLFDKDMHKKLFPASITKIMTALLTIEYVEERGGDYSERIIMSENAVFNLEPNSSNIAMDVDETLSIEDALYALMLASANEVAMGLAEHVAGTTEQFAARMNEKAKALGCLNTNFTNPHGLHNENHYTTAYDMALIMKEAIKYDKFVKLASTPTYEIPVREKHEEVLPIKNTNQTIAVGSQYYVPEVVGGKTGFTDEAGYTLVTYGKNGDAEIVCSVMHDERYQNYVDTKILYNYTFPLYKQSSLLQKGDRLKTVEVLYQAEGGGTGLTCGSVYAVAGEDVLSLIPNVIDKEKVEKEIIIPETVYAPVAKGDVIGKVAMKYEGVKIAEGDLIASDSVNDPLPTPASKPPDLTSSLQKSEQEVFNQEATTASFTREKPLVISDGDLNAVQYSIFIIIACIVLIILLVYLRHRARKKQKSFYYQGYRLSKKK